MYRIVWYQEKNILFMYCDFDDNQKLFVQIMFLFRTCLLM